ncbi:MAG: hypothetical protein ACOX2F_11205 [bacterium]
MKKWLAFLIFFLFFTGNICAEEGKKLEMYVAPTFGLGLGFNSYNAIGALAGADIIFKVWENNEEAPGKMFSGINVGFEYWAPTRSDGFYTAYKRHYFDIPVTGYFSYEFEVNSGVLKYAGPYIAMGFALVVNYEAWESGSGENVSSNVRFFAAFAGSLGGQLLFKNNWAFKFGFGWGAGSRNWGSFNLLAEYRF